MCLLTWRISSPLFQRFNHQSMQFNIYYLQIKLYIYNIINQSISPLESSLFFKHVYQVLIKYQHYYIDNSQFRSAHFEKVRLGFKLAIEPETIHS